MIRWLLYIVFVLYITSCKSVKKTIAIEDEREEHAMVFESAQTLQAQKQETFIEEVEEQVTETSTTVQTDSGLVVVPVKTTVIKRRTEKTKTDSSSDSETRVEEISFFKSETNIDTSKELEETQIPGKVTESIFAGNLWRIISIILTVAGAAGTWYLKKNKASDDTGLG